VLCRRLHSICEAADEDGRSWMRRKESRSVRGLYLKEPFSKADDMAVCGFN
jgi:hypothetical protein